MIKRIALLASFTIVVASCGVPPEPVNVILIVVDTLRADALGCYGAQDGRTPHLDALARQGVQFRTCISQAPWTLPAVASILSGHYPSVLGYDRIRHSLPESTPHIAQELRGEGYATGAVVSNLLLKESFGFARGFDLYDTQHIGGDRQISSKGVVNTALEWLQAVGRPFLLFLHFMDPHYSYMSHESFPVRELYEGALEPGMSIVDIRQQRYDLGAEDLRYLRGLYSGEIRYFDHALANLLRALREDDLAENTVILVTADHGEEFMEHGWIGHTRDMYEEILRVPLIASGPGVLPHLRPDAATLLDIYPTLANLAGAPPAPTPGRDLFGDDRSTRPLFAEVKFDPGDIDESRRSARRKLRRRDAKREYDRMSKRADRQSLVLDDWKIIEDREAGTWQLFDLAVDPGEKQDLAADEPETLKRVRAFLPDLEAVERFESDGPVDVSEEDVERLRTLGYIR